MSACAWKRRKGKEKAPLALRIEISNIQTTYTNNLNLLPLAGRSFVGRKCIENIKKKPSNLHNCQSLCQIDVGWNSQTWVEKLDC